MQSEAIENSGAFSVTACLSGTPLFSGMSVACINHFAEKSDVISRDKGAVIFMQGDEAARFYLIVSGRVKLFRETVNGEEAVTDIPGAGQIFGEEGAFDDEPRDASAQTTEQTRLISLPLSLLRYYAEKEQRMTLNLLGLFTRRQKRRRLEIEHLNVQNAPQRIGCYLLRLCGEQQQGTASVTLLYDKTLLAGRLGIRAETFSRALNALKKDTGITVSGATVTVPDLNRLRAYVCGHCSQSGGCAPEM